MRPAIPTNVSYQKFFHCSYLLRTIVSITPNAFTKQYRTKFASSSFSSLLPDGTLKYFWFFDFIQRKILLSSFCFDKAVNFTSFSATQYEPSCSVIDHIEGKVDFPSCRKVAVCFFSCPWEILTLLKLHQHLQGFELNSASWHCSHSHLNWHKHVGITYFCTEFMRPIFDYVFINCGAKYITAGLIASSQYYLLTPNLFSALVARFRLYHQCWEQLTNSTIAAEGVILHKGQNQIQLKMPRKKGAGHREPRMILPMKCHNK